MLDTDEFYTVKTGLQSFAADRPGGLDSYEKKLRTFLMGKDMDHDCNNYNIRERNLEMSNQ